MQTHDELSLERKQGIVGVIQAIEIKCRKGKFGTKPELIKLELVCKLYTIEKLIKLTFQCNLQSWIWSSLEGFVTNLLQLV